MNPNVLLRSPDFVCLECNIRCAKQSDWTRHINTAKHVKQTTVAPQQVFDCSYCQYSTDNVKDWNKHLNTKKHSQHNVKSYDCSNCEKQFTNYKTCWSHKQKCSSETKYSNIIDKLINENQELRTFFIQEIRNIVAEQKSDTQKLVSEIMKNGTHVTNNNNNKSFNINLYLTEQCKDAINFSDFIKSIEVSHQDLENNAQLGFVNGISKIILDNLKQLSVNERPIHCTDLKRETMYIKDEDKWTKEENDTKLNNAIQAVSRKSIGKLLEWKGENDEYQDMDSKFSGLCIVIQRNSMAGYDRAVFYPKVIHAIAKEILVAK